MLDDMFFLGFWMASWALGSSALFVWLANLYHLVCPPGAVGSFPSCWDAITMVPVAVSRVDAHNRESLAFAEALVGCAALGLVIMASAGVRAHRKHDARAAVLFCSVFGMGVLHFLSACRSACREARCPPNTRGVFLADNKDALACVEMVNNTWSSAVFTPCKAHPVEALFDAVEVVVWASIAMSVTAVIMRTD